MNRQWFHNRLLVTAPGPETGERDFVPRRSRLLTLSAREVDVLRQMATGKSDQEIGAALCLSWKTVKTHRTRIFQKLGVKNRVQAVLWWLKEEGSCDE